MAPRATQASQSQRNRPGPSQSQRARRDPDEDEEEEEEVSEEYDEDEEMVDASQAGQKKSKASGKADGGKKKKRDAPAPSTGGLNTDEIKRRAYDLVRIALFEEPKRGVLKRTDISKKILAENPRGFNAVFEKAQSILGKTFGMEMVELMTRSDRDALSVAKDDENPEKKKAASASSKTYIVRSILDPQIVHDATKQNRDILKEETKSMKAVGLVRDLDVDVEEPRGSLLAWDVSESVALTGVMQLILCLILVTGRSLPEVQLKNQLKQFHLHWTTKFPLPLYQSVKEISLEDYLSQLVKQNYLDRVRSELPGATASQNKGRRKSRLDDNGEEGVFEWKWGTRAHAEMGEESIAQFMADFMHTRWLEEQRQIVQEEEEEEEAAARNKKRRTGNSGQKPVAERLAELDTKAKRYGELVLKDIRLSATQGAMPLTDIKYAAANDEE